MKHKDWSSFLLHCSSISNVMGFPIGLKAFKPSEVERLSELKRRDFLNDKEQADLDKKLAKEKRLLDPELNEGAKKYLIGRYAFERYNTRVASLGAGFSPSAKGTELEEQGLALLSKMDGIKYVKSNKAANNEYLLGRCDIECPKTGRIIDLKVSWSINSFFATLSTELDKRYWYQMQGYLDVYDRPEGEVCFVLLNTPYHLVEQEKSRVTYKYLMGEIDKEKYEEDIYRLSLAFDYERIPTKRRIIRYRVSRHEDSMQFVYKKVIRCRQWLQEFEAKHQTSTLITVSNENYEKYTPTEEDNP